MSSPRCQRPCKNKPGRKWEGGGTTTNTAHSPHPRLSRHLLLPHHLCRRSCGCHRRLIRQSEMEKMLTRRLSSVTQNKRGRGWGWMERWCCWWGNRRGAMGEGGCLCWRGVCCDCQSRRVRPTLCCQGGLEEVSKGACGGRKGCLGRLSRSKCVCV